jgi:hypothetical protein
MKKLLCLTLAVLCFTGCSPEDDKKAEPFDAVKVIIAGRTFKIPKGYFDGAKPTGKLTESVVLEYSLPGFRVLPKHPQKKKARKELIMAGKMNGMSLETSSARPSFDVMIKNHRSGKDRIGISQGEVFGLEKFSVLDWKGRMLVQPDDTFIERAGDGTVKSFLRCSPPGKDKVPGCRHKFRDKGLLYAIRWSIRELPNWRKQQNAAIHFIDSMEFNVTMQTEGN